MDESVTLEVIYCGICGSDLQKLNGAVAPVLSLRGLGHEVVARNGKQTVVVNPLIGCDKCDNCAGGAPMFCKSLIALGRNTPGGFSGTVTVPKKNVVPLGNVAPELGVLADPLAVVIHGLQGLPHTGSVTIIGDGVIAQLACIYILTQTGIPECVMVAKSSARSKTLKQAFAAQYKEQGKQFSSFDFKTYRTLPSVASPLILETVGREQADTLAAAIHHVGERGQIISFGVYPEGYDAGLPVRNLLYKEAILRGVNSFAPSDFSDAVQQIEDAPERFLPLLGAIFSKDKFRDAIEAASNKNDERPRKIIVSPGEE